MFKDSTDRSSKSFIWARGCGTLPLLPLAVLPPLAALNRALLLALGVYSESEGGFAGDDGKLIFVGDSRREDQSLRTEQLTCEKVAFDG